MLSSLSRIASNLVITLYVRFASVKLGGGVVKVIGVGVAKSVPYYTSGVGEASPIRTSLDAGIPYKIGKPAVRNRMQLKLR